MRSRHFWGIRRFIKYKLLFWFDHFTISKTINWCVVKTEKLLKISNMAGMPYQYTIDPINICNLKCPLCPTGLGILGRSRGRMSLDNFKDLIDQIAPYAFLVELYNWGEPYLHPQIFEMIAYAHEKRIGTRLSSNMNYFNPEMAMATINSGLDAINISLDGIDQKTYESYRKGGNIETVFNNIRSLIEAKRKLKSRTPFITIRMVVNKNNEDQVRDIQQYAYEIGADLFTAAPIFIDTTQPDQIADWLPKNERYTAYDYKNDRYENTWHCDDLWESMTINWDGGTAPCCWLHENKNDFGNAFNDNVKNIWNSNAYVYSRKVIAHKNQDMGPNITICGICKGHPRYLHY